MEAIFICQKSKLLVCTPKGVPELKNALSSQALSVKTETTSYNSRYDIEIKIGDMLFVLENKTKSIGDIPQFKKYDSSNTFLIALGFSDVSFSSEVTSKYPLIIYKDILNILNQIAIKKDNEYSILTEHYRAYLERELSIIDDIVACYKENQIDIHNKLNNTISTTDCYTSNDFRFLNLYYIEKLKDYFGILHFPVNRF